MTTVVVIFPILVVRKVVRELKMRSNATLGRLEDYFTLRKNREKVQTTPKVHC